MPAVRKALVGFSQGALVGSESVVQVRGKGGICALFLFLFYFSQICV